MKKFFLLLVCILVPKLVSAATVHFDVPQIVSKGAEIVVRVQVNTGGDKINAMSGDIVFDSSKLGVSKIYDGDSAVTLWLEHPHSVVGKDSTQTDIAFSGVTPGGFQGNFTLFTLVLKPLVTGKINLDATNLLAYRNNGDGSPVILTLDGKTQIEVSGVSTTTIAFTDTTPPEAFTPLISTSPDLFNGHYFVSWNTQDKGTGIDHYEYAYSYIGSPASDDWKLATSPLEFDQRQLSHEVFIKAVDKAGNIRLASVAGPHRYRTFTLWGILILILLCAFLFLKRRSSLLSR